MTVAMLEEMGAMYLEELQLKRSVAGRVVSAVLLWLGFHASFPGTGDIVTCANKDTLVVYASTWLMQPFLGSAV
jgi:hypothetical protein